MHALLSQQLPSLRELRMPESNLQNDVFLSDGSISEYLPLQVLDVSWCEELNNTVLAALFQCTPALEVAILRGTASDTQTIVTLAQHCSRL